MIFLGDLAWYSRTNPGLSYAVHYLAQFMQNPGEAYVRAALRASPTTAAPEIPSRLTAVVGQSHDHRSKAIANSDANFIANSIVDFVGANYVNPILDHVACANENIMVCVEGHIDTNLKCSTKPAHEPT